MDSMNITVLDDGTLKVETGPVSPLNHMSAEAFLRNIAQAAGGTQERRHQHGVLGATAHTLKHPFEIGHSH
jgi:hypothetical protein